MECSNCSTLVASEYFDGDIIITDPCYLIRADRCDDWQLSDYGEEMDIFGFSTYLSQWTLIGDWYCDVFQGSVSDVWTPVPSNRQIGSFSADACRVGVFYLRDVLKYNPSFDMHITHPRCVCWIKEFKGTVSIINVPDPDGDDSIHVTGSGSLDFFSRESYWNDVFSCKNSEKN